MNPHWQREGLEQSRHVREPTLPIQVLANGVNGSQNRPMQQRINVEVDTISMPRTQGTLGQALTNTIFLNQLVAKQTELASIGHIAGANQPARQLPQTNPVNPHSESKRARHDSSGPANRPALMYPNNTQPAIIAPQLSVQHSLPITTDERPPELLKQLALKAGLGQAVPMAPVTQGTTSPEMLKQLVQLQAGIAEPVPAAAGVASTAILTNNPTDSSSAAGLDVTPRRAVQQNTSAKGGKNYHRCQHCDILFNTLAMYTVHMGQHAADDPFKCNVCNVVLDGALDFQCHFARGHSHGEIKTVI